MVKVKVQKQQLKNTMGKIQNQYDQIMARAEDSQNLGINRLCEGWQNPNAKEQIIKLVNVLNEKMEKITKRYMILFEKLNGWAGETVRSGGGNWSGVSFESKTFHFSANMAKDGDNGQNTVFDESLIFEGIGKVSQMSKNIIKNQRDTSRIFSNNNECFGITNDSPAVFDNFKTKMEKFASDIEAEVDQCVASFNLVTEEQKEKLNMILDKYSTDNLPTYSSDGWTSTKVGIGEIDSSNDSGNGSSGSNGDSNSGATSDVGTTGPVDPNGASYEKEYSE